MLIRGGCFGVPDPAEGFARYAEIGCDHVQGHAAEYIGERGDEIFVFFFGRIAKVHQYPFVA